MEENSVIRILNTREAANLLGFHPYRFLEKVRTLGIPGRKIGRTWRFVDVDLIEWFRSSYAGAEPVSEKKDTKCQFTKDPTVKYGGHQSNYPKADEYANLLGLHQKRKQKPGRVSMKLICGDAQG